MDAYIIDTVRTPRGKGRPGGALDSVRPVELLAGLQRALGERQPDAIEAIDDLVLGCVTQHGDQGADLARIAVLYGGWPEHVSGVTINRFCASGLDAINLAASKVASGMEGLVVGGGIESMSRVPAFSDEGAWFTDPRVAEVTRFVPMGFAADVVANLEGMDRDQLDAFAVRSHQRAAEAQRQGHFDRSLVAVRDEQGSVVLDRDELVRPNTSVETIARFEPAFTHEAGHGWALERYPQLERVTPVHHRATAPSLADGAGLAVVASEARAQALGLRPRARILAWANASVEPVVMLTAARTATERALARAGLQVGDIDLFEVNEAFAAVALEYQRTLGIDDERFNVNGGTIALGHAMGATGAILVATLLDELERRDLRRGVIAVSGGAGLGSATVIERTS